MTSPGLSRRRVITAATTVGVGVPLLAACSSDSEDEPGTTTSSTAGGGSGGVDGGALASTADLTVGGAVFLDDPAVVVTAPAEGEYKAFSRVCTHQGCPVTDLLDGNIHCNCHQSQFSIEDGSNVVGPNGSAATLQALQEFPIKVEGDRILPA